MIVLGPRVVAGRIARRPEARLIAGTTLACLLAAVCAPLFSGALISTGDIAHMSAENFNRLNWSV